MEIKNLPEKYQLIWQNALPFLKQGRPGDDVHAANVVETIIENQSETEMDLDILIPAAILHDIGHSAILPEHFKFITGSEKLMNGKLVHMLAGAKIAQEILTEAGCEIEKVKEVVEIVATHDFDQIKDVDLEKYYDSQNKKMFHDIDSFDRFNQERLDNAKDFFKNREEMIKLLESSLDGFFYDSFRKKAEEFLNNFKSKELYD